jgi:hypothetical protein
MVVKDVDSDVRWHDVFLAPHVIRDHCASRTKARGRGIRVYIEKGNAQSLRASR